MLITTRRITCSECPWLDEDVPEGTVVYRYRGPTYGCISTGIAVSLEDGATPFFELPRDAVTILQGSGSRHA